MASYKDSLLSYDPWNYKTMPDPLPWQIDNTPLNLWDAVAFKDRQAAQGLENQKSQAALDERNAFREVVTKAGDSADLKDIVPELQKVAAANGDITSLRGLSDLIGKSDNPDKQEEDRLMIYSTLSRVSEAGAVDYAKATGLDKKYPGLTQTKQKGESAPKAAQPYSVMDPKTGEVVILDKSDPQFASKVAGKVPYKAPPPADPKDQAIADLLRGITGGQAPQGASMFGGMNPVPPQPGVPPGMKKQINRVTGEVRYVPAQ